MEGVMFRTGDGALRAPGGAHSADAGLNWWRLIMQKLLAAAALAATLQFSGAAAWPIGASSDPSWSKGGERGGVLLTRGGGMGGGGIRPSAGGMGGGGGGMMNSGGGMGSTGGGMNSGGVGAGSHRTNCPQHQAKSKSAPNPLNPLTWLSPCDSKY
jgi:hypothetical protein